MADPATAPLSFQQEQLWLVEQAPNARGLYNELSALRLTGELDLSALERSVDLLVQRHESLRTVFPSTEGGPVQLIGPPRPVPGSGHRDLTTLPAGEREQALDGHARRLAQTPFDLAAGPLLRWSVCRLGPREHVLLLCIHHLVCDGQSMKRLLGELAGSYGAGGFRREPSAPGRYAQYAVAQRAAATGPAWDDALKYWTAELAGVQPVLDFAPDAPRPPVKSYRGRRDTFTADQSAVTALERLTRQADGSRTAALLAAFAALAYRYTGRRDMLVGTAASGWPGPAYDQTVGMFASIVPVRLRLTGQDTFRQVIEMSADAFCDAADHLDVPFEHLVRLVKPDRDASLTPLVQAVCTVWEPGPDRTRFGDLSARRIDLPRERARFDLLIEHVITPDGWALAVEYDTALFQPGQIAAMAGHYQRLICDGAASPGLPVAAMAMLSPAELAVLGTGEAIVLDGDGNVVPAGVAGRLHAATRGPAREPSGDIARRTADGDVERLGRVYRRVRLGEHTTQLERVEEVLSGCPGVDTVTVVPDASAGRGFTAVVTGAGDPTELAREVSAFAAAQLPRYLVPDPVAAGASSGERVPRPAAGASSAVGASRALAVLSRIWTELLDVSDIQPEDDFFELGGHSMLASQFARRAAEELGVEVPLLTVFEYPRLGELAARLSREHPDRCGLSMAQLAIWVNAQLTLGADGDFNAAQAYRIRGVLDPASLEHAIRWCLQHQPGLRASFSVDTDPPAQRFSSAPPFRLPVTDCAGSSLAAGRADAERQARQLASEPFDLSQPPLLRARLFRVAPDEHLLSYAIHHLVTDGVSMAVFHRDVGAAYAAYRNGKTPAERAQRTHYADYVAAEQSWLRSAAARRAREYWRSMLEGWHDLALPSAAENRLTLAVATRRHQVPGPVAGAVNSLARLCHATPFMVVSAAFAAVLHDWSGQDDILVGTQVENRPSPDLNDLMGCFVNVVPLRVDCRGNPSFEELVARVRDTALGAFVHQRLPFAEVVQAVHAPRRHDRMPLVQVTTQWVRPGQARFGLVGCKTERLPVTAQISRYEMTLFAGPEQGKLVLELEYATDLWDGATITDRLGQLVRVLGNGSRRPVATLRELTG